jgi:hypothetical protein
MELVPEAVSVRTHGLLQSTALLAKIMEETPALIDASLFLPRAQELRPVEYQWAQRTLLRIPYFWEDDFEMERRDPCWQLAPLLAAGSGLKIFDFHPVHIYLNSHTMEAYRRLKEREPNLTEASPELAAELAQAEPGSQTLFVELAKYLSDKKSFRLVDLTELYDQRVSN